MGGAVGDEYLVGGAGDPAGPAQVCAHRPSLPGPWVVQPLVESVRTEGETSVFVFGGRPVSQVDKVPAHGEIRVHEEYGGRSRPVPLDPGKSALAATTVASTAGLLGTDLLYARVDIMRLPDGSLVVSELEVTEPGLYLDVLPGNASAFVEIATQVGQAVAQLDA